MDNIIPLLFILGILVLGAGELTLKIYGIYLCFKYKWYIGVCALVVPFFAEIIAIAKLFFKKDLLT